MFNLKQCSIFLWFQNQIYVLKCEQYQFGVKTWLWMGQLFSVKDSALSRLVRSDSFNKNMGNDLSCLKCEGERKETDSPLGKYSFFLL